MDVCRTRSRGRTAAALRASVTVLLALTVLAGCTGRSGVVADEIGESVTSGGVTATLVEGAPDNGVETAHVRVTDASGRELYRGATGHSMRHGVGLIWDQQGRLWVLSSDIGTVTLVRDGDTWTERTGLPMPPEVAEVAS